MADSNGAVTTIPLETIEQVIERKHSVQKSDYASGTYNFVFPAYGFDGWHGRYTALPPALPGYNRFGFYTQRDYTLLSTPSHEAMWASAVAIAVTKAAAWGWEIDSNVPLRRKRAHQLYQTATAGIFVGWIPFIYAHIRSYLLCGYAIVELERETTSYYSRITGLHHLNPLRCRFTDNPKRPIEYMDRRGKIHELEYWQVLMFADQVDPTDGEHNGMESAAMRAYDRIAIMQAVHRYLYEKVTGKRPLSLEFIQGVTSKTLDDAIKSSENDMERKGSTIYRGVVAIPIPGDVPIVRISIPIAEVPDGFDYQDIHDNTAVDYCAAIGLDVNDLDPRLAQRMALGSGAQALVLDSKTRGKGLASWKADFTQQQNMWVLDTSTTFTFSETTIEDELKKAQLQHQRAQTRDLQIKAHEITNLEARNLAVDAGDLPQEFVQNDITVGGTIASTDKPAVQQNEDGITTAPPPLMLPQTPQEQAQERQERFSGMNGQEDGKKPTEAKKEAKEVKMSDVLQEEIERMEVA